MGADEALSAAPLLSGLRTPLQRKEGDEERMRMGEEKVEEVEKKEEEEKKDEGDEECKEGMAKHPSARKLMRGALSPASLTCLTHLPAWEDGGKARKGMEDGWEVWKHEEGKR